MTATQAIDLASSALPPAGTIGWTVFNPNQAGLYMSPATTNYSGLMPNTDDFCWEVWLSIDAVGGAIMGFDSNIYGSFFTVFFTNNNDGTFSVYFNVAGSTPTSQNTYSISQYTGNGEWFHLAFARSGSTVSAWINGQLASQLTGFSGTIDSAIGAGGIWIFGGPVGDRDQSYANPTSGSWRNMRYVTGNSVYGTATSFTPPLLDQDIAVVTGTKYIFWITSITSTGGFGVNWPPDYTADASWIFTASSGDTTGPNPQPMPYNFPGGYPSYPWSNSTTVVTQGVFANMGTAPNQPFLTNAGPLSPWANTVGNFTMTGTNVRIYSASSPGGPGDQPFIYMIWIYVPGGIANECKNLMVFETANGMVLNIGRTGYGFDWFSIENREGTELLYGPHVWARNAWNYLVVERDVGTGTSAVWAGWAGLSTIKKLATVDTGFQTYSFAGQPTALSIGCKEGSSVSCQMYIGEIWGWVGYNSIFYPTYFDSIPVQTIQPFLNYSDSVILFTFTGTNGSTDIQPG